MTSPSLWPCSQQGGSWSRRELRCFVVQLLWSSFSLKCAWITFRPCCHCKGSKNSNWASPRGYDNDQRCHSVTPSLQKVFEGPVTEPVLGKDTLPQLSLQEASLNHWVDAELVQTIPTAVSSIVCLMQGAGRGTETPAYEGGRGGGLGWTDLKPQALHVCTKSADEAFARGWWNKTYKEYFSKWWKITWLHDLQEVEERKEWYWRNMEGMIWPKNGMGALNFQCY